MKVVVRRGTLTASPRSMNSRRGTKKRLWCKGGERRAQNNTLNAFTIACSDEMEMAPKEVVCTLPLTILFFISFFIFFFFPSFLLYLLLSACITLLPPPIYRYTRVHAPLSLIATKSSIYVVHLSDVIVKGAGGRRCCLGRCVKAPALLRLLLLLLLLVSSPQ